MKKILLVALPFAMALFSACSASRTASTDSVEIADSSNKVRSGLTGSDEDASGFLVDAADARMMDIKESRAAVKTSSSPAIRSYARLMIKEQTALLTRIKRLAAAQSVTLPVQISNSKKEGFSELVELKGDDFDGKYVKMQIIDHERDVSEFKKAQSVKNPAIAAFATEKLPVIQSHLDKINAIRDERKK